MNRVTLLLSTFVLTACDGPDGVPQVDQDQLEDRVAILEAKVAELTAKSNEPDPTAIAQAPPPTPRMTFQLIGASFREGDDFRYPSRELCEEAKQALLDSWQEDDERNRARGVVFTSRPTPSCIPL